MKNYLKISYIIIVLLFICWELNAQMALPTFQAFSLPGIESGSQTFSYTGAQQTFTVPSVSTITIKAYGAQGEDERWDGKGGKGGYAKGDLSVTAGQTLYIYVGGQNGYNGGGDGHAAVASNGGGGGYYGGGGTSVGNCGGGAGGGGTSWTGSLTNDVLTGGVQSGNGQVIISW